MTAQTESIIRATVQTDTSISAQALDLAIRALRGEKLVSPDELDLDNLAPALSYSEAREKLRMSRSVFFEQIAKGRLVRIVGSGRQGVAITRKSFLHVYEGKYGRYRA